MQRLDTDSQRAIVRGSAPFYWAIALAFLEDSTELNVVDSIADNTFLTERGVTTVGILIIALALNVLALMREEQVEGTGRQSWFARLVKIVPGRAHYAAPTVDTSHPSMQPVDPAPRTSIGRDLAGMHERIADLERRQGDK